MNRASLRLWIALAVLVAGLGVTLRALSQTSERRRVLQEKVNSLEALAALQADRQGETGLIQSFQSLSEKSPRPLADIARETLPGTQPELRRRDPRAAADGWTVLGINVTIEDVRLVDLGRFFSAAADGRDRPAWNLAECTITASETKPGFARVVLLMEALEKAGETR